MKRKRFLRTVVCAALVAGMLIGCGSGLSISNDPFTSAASRQTESSSLRQEQLTESSVTQAVSHQTSAGTSSKAPDVGAEEPILSETDRLLQQMTLRQKVGQLFFIRPDSLDLTQTQEQIINSSASGVTSLTESMRETLAHYPVGGIVMFGKNITSPEQIITFNEALQNAADIPLFISADEEGGLVSRLANHPAFDLPKYESAADVGSSGDASDALEMGQTIGAYLKKYGFNMDFAPVADVNTNPNNPVIGTRAFSSDADTAARMAAAMAQGLRQEGISPVFKHFPGHGDTAQDSHYGIAVSYKTQEEMERCEWLPFEAAGSGDCIMMGHIALPAITNDMTPASLSYDIVTGILRNQLGFQGVVMTDSLEMGAITDEYESGEAAVAAILAGCDILLGPDGLQEAFDAVVKAVEDGTISEQRLDESVRRILEFKQR